MYIVCGGPAMWFLVTAVVYVGVVLLIAGIAGMNGKDSNE